jgi:hypothetical protein
MRYAGEVNRSASQSSALWGRGRRRRKYLRESAKQLSAAACTSDPVAALKTLGDLYKAECETPDERAKSLEKTAIAERLMRACGQLALGKDPAPIAG